MNIKNYCRQLVLLTLSILAGCSALEQLDKSNIVKKPDFSYAGISVSSLSMDGIDLAIDMKVINPNGFPLALAGYQYDLSVNNSTVVSSPRHEGFKVPARGSHTITVPLAFTFKELSNLADNFSAHQEIQYGLNAKLFVDIPVLSAVPLQLDHQDSIKIPQVPKVSLSNIAFDRFDLSSVNMKVDLAITNPNSFVIDLKQFDYKLDVANKSWISGRLPDGLKIAPKQTQTVSIPVQLGMLEVGRSILSKLMDNSPLDYSLSGNMALNSDSALLSNISLPFSFSGQTR